MRNAHFGILALAVAALMPRPAAAEDISINYNVDVGPLTMTVVKFTLNATDAGVRAKARIRSNGMSRVFSEYSVVADAETRMVDAKPVPVSFHLLRERDDERKETSLTWTPDGSLTFTPPIKNKEKRERIEAAISSGVADPITAVLRMGATGQNPCPSVHQVFDGRDVFELSLTDKGQGKLGDDAAWRGPVQRCEVTWTPIAGRAKDKGTPGDSYDVAFAAVSKLPSGAQLWLPVQMSGRLKGLGFKAYATKVGAGKDAGGGD
ncbi:DUF3108 domain-containing protein [Aestuariivirga sp.]|uniref:DUF3108 domain-containing protein n=1 Tax=Aestuariivirga sp. TaxID=2650926 RepID=UPI003BABDE41